MKSQHADGVHPQGGGNDQAVESNGKKRYEPPQLLEWGSLTDLTSGKFTENQDLPFKGGTRHV